MARSFGFDITFWDVKKQTDENGEEYEEDYERNLCVEGTYYEGYRKWFNKANECWEPPEDAEIEIDSIYDYELDKDIYMDLTDDQIRSIEEKIWDKINNGELE